MPVRIKIGETIFADQWRLSDRVYTSFVRMEALDLVRSGRLDVALLREIMPLEDKPDETRMALIERAIDQHYGFRMFSTGEFYRPRYAAGVTQRESIFQRVFPNSELAYSRLAEGITQDWPGREGMPQHGHRKEKFFSGTLIPPAPASEPEEFNAFLIQRGVTIFTNMMQLRMWRMWDNVLVPIFYRIMGKEIEEVCEDPIATRKTEIDRRHMWFVDMGMLGISRAQITEYFADRERKEKTGNTSIRAAAWLNSFMPSTPVPMDDTVRMLSAALLVYEMHHIHRIAPDAEGADYTGLLTPFAGDASAIVQFIRLASRIEEDSIVSRAERLLTWHGEPSHELAAWLMDVIERSDEQRYKRFCENEFATDEDGFERKVLRLQNAGVDIKPLMRALNRKFRTGGTGHDRGGSTPHGNQGPTTSFGGEGRFRRVGIGFTELIDETADAALESGITAFCTTTEAANTAYELTDDPHDEMSTIAAPAILPGNLTIRA